jgi:hypothetical protein
LDVREAEFERVGVFRWEGGVGGIKSSKNKKRRV